MKLPMNIKLENVNFKKTGIISGCTALGGIIFSYLLFPMILKAMLKHQVVLTPGSFMRGMWSDIPFPLDFRIYVFNLTNPDEFLNGGKPRVRELGPYMFDEWKVKYNQVDDDEEDTITFDFKNTFIFRPDKSNGLTGEEMITWPHMMVMGVLLAVNLDREPMLPMVSKALKIIMNTSDVLLTAPFMDLFFRGMDVNCGHNEFSAKAVCSAFSDNPAFVKANETLFKFSLFGGKNGTKAGSMTAYRGKKNIKDLGRIIRFNGQPEQDVWDGEECNSLQGTDSTIFPPFMKKEEGLWAFTPDICRSMGAHYVGRSRYDGMPTYEYSLDMGDLKNTDELHCFCRDPPDDCPPKGTMDLTPCMEGIPMLASKPHFYDADASLGAAVDGLTPNKHEHDIYVHFELISGSPLSAAKRLQFALEIVPIDIMEQMQNIKPVVLPLFWIEEGAQLNSTYTNQLKYQLFLGLKFNAAVKWLTILGGTFGAIMSSYMWYKQQNQVTEIQEVVPTRSATPPNEMERVHNEKNRNQMHIEALAAMQHPDKGVSAVAGDRRSALDEKKY